MSSFGEGIIKKIFCPLDSLSLLCSRRKGKKFKLTLSLIIGKKSITSKLSNIFRPGVFSQKLSLFEFFLCQTFAKLKRNIFLLSFSKIMTGIENLGK